MGGSCGSVLPPALVLVLAFVLAAPSALRLVVLVVDAAGCAGCLPACSAQMPYRRTGAQAHSRDARQMPVQAPQSMSIHTNTVCARAKVRACQAAVRPSMCYRLSLCCGPWVLVLQLDQVCSVPVASTSARSIRVNVYISTLGSPQRQTAHTRSREWKGACEHTGHTDSPPTAYADNTHTRESGVNGAGFTEMRGVQP